MKKKKIVYAVLLVFSFLMLAAMLFAPLILNQLYPEVNTQAVANKWAISTSTATTNLATHSPFWVQLYRQNEWIPGMLCFLAFSIVTAFIKKEQAEEDATTEQPQTSHNTPEDEITKTISYYDYEIAESEKRDEKILAAQKQAQQPLKQTMAEIWTTLKEKEQQEAGCIQERDNLIGNRKILLKELEAELAKYRRDYREALTNDPTKNTFINPEWENEVDIINYYKIKVQ